MKAEIKIYKGIEYVLVSQLPAEQQTIISQTISKRLYIKILIDGKIVGNCLQYKDYDFWYENVYRQGDKPLQTRVLETEKDTSALVDG
ncbi:hypothetical protein [Ohtaekwangia koreensis]|uniref:Uncharacterized protein n=1 Tax=Ohtaekwangia koreensis TaxID=688867 RepID=A0A1T5LF45_9BACT|nr:hypothetical protein [Ohtaekwangia koreensis]SKC74621.1 hypothetical protein SAMN05660236_3099 [Ohtaekwangia koreensis]